MSVCCHMTFFGRELEHFHFARQVGGTGFAWVTTALQGPPSLHRPPPRVSLCQGLWISSLEQSATTSLSHRDELAEIFLRGWLPRDEAFPRTVNSKHTKYLSTTSGPESCFRIYCVGKADFGMSHVVAQHNAVQ